MLFSPKQNADSEVQALPPPYVPGPYADAPEPSPASVPSLASFCLRVLVDDPDQIRLPARLPLRHRRLLDEVVSDPACLDPRLWATLVQIYDGLPRYLRHLRLPLSDVHLPLLQAIASTPLFSLVTVLSLPGCVHLTDETVLQLRFLHSLTALDASATSLSAYALRTLAACLQLESESSDATVYSRRHRGPWQLRVLALRDCKNMSSDGLSSLLSFPLLSAIDLRGTPCLPPKSYPFKPCPLPSQSLLHPATLSQSLHTLLDRQPALYSSPHPFFIHIDTLHHTPSTTRPPRPSVAPQDAFVTVPSSSKAPIKVSSSVLIEKRIQEREDALAHERNKDAWYERQDRLDYDIIHPRKIRPRASSNLPSFKPSSKPLPPLKPRLKSSPSFASRNQKIMGPVPRSSFPLQNRHHKPLLHSDANTNTLTGHHITTITANTTLSSRAHPHLIPAPPTHTLTPLQPRSTLPHPTTSSPTLTPAFAYDHDNSSISRPNSSAAAAENNLVFHSVPNPEHTSASDHAVSPYHSRFQSESHHVRHHRERGVARDREGKEEGGSSCQPTRAVLPEHTPMFSPSSESFSTLRLINDLPPRSPTMNEAIPNTTNARRHYHSVPENQEYPQVVRAPRASVVNRRDGEAAGDEDDDCIPALSRTHGTHHHQHSYHTQSSFSRLSPLSTVGPPKVKVQSTNAIGKTRNPGSRPGPSASVVPHPDACDSDNDNDNEYEYENHLRLYRPPPPWSALDDALNVRHAEEVERERRIAGYPVPFPHTSSSSSSSLSRAGGGGEIAKVDMSSERAARVKRELDAVLQAAAKRRRLDMNMNRDSPIGDMDGEVGGHALTRSTMGDPSLSSSSSAMRSGSGNHVRRQSQPPPLPLVNESTSRNPFRRKPLTSGSGKYATPPALSKVSVASGSTREKIREDDDEIMDDEDEHDKAYQSNDQDNDNNDERYDDHYHNHNHQKNRDVRSASMLAQSMSAVAVAETSSTNKARDAETTKQAMTMTPISSVKVPILPSKIREQALARERKESLGGTGSRSASAATPKGGSSASTKTKTKQGQGQGQGQARFDWKSWGGGGSASSSTMR